MPEESATAQQSFCARLRAERLRRGITLGEIAASTKVKVALLAGLEANDLARWPSGSVYRRAFVRDYAAAVGLPLAPTLAEFDRLFPDMSGSPFGLTSGVTTERAANLRLMLAVEATTEAEPARGGSPPRPADARRQIIVALLDVGIVLLLASAVTRLTHLNPWLGISVLALGCQSLGTLCFGQSLGAWWLTTRAPTGGIGGLLRSRAHGQTSLIRMSEWGRNTQTWVTRGLSRVAPAAAFLVRRPHQAIPIARMRDWAVQRTTALSSPLKRHLQRSLSLGVATMTMVVVISDHVPPGDRRARADERIGGALNNRAAAYVAPKSSELLLAGSPPTGTRVISAGERPRSVGGSVNPSRLDGRPRIGTLSSARRAADRRGRRRPRGASRRHPDAASETPKSTVEP